MHKEESCQRLVPKMDGQAIFIGENAQKHDFWSLYSSLSAFKMLGRLFPFAHGMKHAQGRVMQKADTKSDGQALFLRENVLKMRFS